MYRPLSKELYYMCGLFPFQQEKRTIEKGLDLVESYKNLLKKKRKCTR